MLYVICYFLLGFVFSFVFSLAGFFVFREDFPPGVLASFNSLEHAAVMFALTVFWPLILAVLCMMLIGRLLLWHLHLWVAAIDRYRRKQNLKGRNVS